MALTRREFLATSGGALALTAVALSWPRGPADAAASLPAGAPDPDGAPTSAGAASSGIERQRRFRDGALRPFAWSRGGGSHRVALRDAERVEIAIPHRGRALLRIADRSAHDAIARELSPGVLQEVLAEARRLARAAGA